MDEPHTHEPIERYAGLTALYTRLVSEVLTTMSDRLDTLDASMRDLRDEVHRMLRERALRAEGSHTNAVD